MGKGRAVPPPVTHLPASQLRLALQITGQYDNTPNVTVAVLVREAASDSVVSLPDKARLTCNGSNIKPTFPSTTQPCPREPPGGAYRIVFTDEHGAASTFVVPVPVGSLAFISPRDRSSVPIPTNNQLTIRFAIPVAPPKSSVTVNNITAWCHAASNQPCNSVAYLEQYIPAATASSGVPTATVFENRGPPTPTPSSSKPTATAVKDRGSPTPAPGPTLTPTVPFITVTQQGAWESSCCMATSRRTRLVQA
jgi:hypothetical protein